MLYTAESTAHVHRSRMLHTAETALLSTLTVSQDRGVAPMHAGIFLIFWRAGSGFYTLLTDTRLTHRGEYNTPRGMYHTPRRMSTPRGVLPHCPP